jgi:hypothetical protein
MNDEWLKKLPAELLLEVSKRLLSRQTCRGVNDYNFQTLKEFQS